MSTPRTTYQVFPRCGPALLLTVCANACPDTLLDIPPSHLTHHAFTIITPDDLPDSIHVNTPLTWSHALFFPAQVEQAASHESFRTMLRPMAPLLDDASFYLCHDASTLCHFTIESGELRDGFTSFGSSKDTVIEQYIRSTLQHLQRHPDLDAIVFPHCQKCGERFAMTYPPTRTCSNCDAWEIIAKIPRAALDEAVDLLKQNRRIFAIHTLRDACPERLVLGDLMSVTDLMQSLLDDSQEP